MSKVICLGLVGLVVADTDDGAHTNVFLFYEISARRPLC